MTAAVDSLKKRFRAGQHAEAIADAEALCRRHPEDAGLHKLCATMHLMVRNYPRALELLRQARRPGHEDPDILFNIGMCQRELKDFDAAAQAFGAYTEAFPKDAAGWAGLAECRLEMRAFDEAQQAAARSIALDPNFATAWAVRGHAQAALGHEDAVASYRQALRLAPDDDATLKKATLALLEGGRGEDAIDLCREVLRAKPGSLTARLGAEWVLSELVPLWHVPMMNEPERNQAFHDGLQAAVAPDTTVFEIGTGSGLLAMMAARLGARSVTTCEAVPLIARTAATIVERNGYADRVTVIARPSVQVEVGRDLPERADILLHEVFSSELLGEHVLPAIEDAKARLLKPGGQVLPSAASIMIALVGGEELGRNLHVEEAFGFDLRAFNAIHPKRRPLYREDLAPTLMSAPIEAFRFDFAKASTFPPEHKRLQATATTSGRCWGVIQWIRIELGPGIVFENHPAKPRAVSNWQHTVHGFEQPLELEQGATVALRAMHDRTRPWFDKA